MDNIVFSPVNVESVPPIDEFLDGDLDKVWRGLLAQVVRDIRQPKRDPRFRRQIKLELTFTPDAEARSALVALAAASVKVGGEILPPPQRIAFRRQGNELKAVLRDDSERKPYVFVSEAFTIDPEGLPSLRSFAGGQLDGIFRRQVAHVLLNLDDPRAKVQFVRKITISVDFWSDEDRTVLSHQIKGVKPTLAPMRYPDPGTLYLEVGSHGFKLEDEPEVFLHDSDSDEPIGVRKGRQSSIEQKTVN